MVCASEIYQWFKELPAFGRIDFIFNIVQLCLPNELRYFSTLLEDMNGKEYTNLREIEERSNSPNEFLQYPHMHLSPEVVHKLCLSLSLLKATNQKVAQAIYEILRIHFNYATQLMSQKNEYSSEVLLMYSMACYHPAFNFNNKLKLSKYLKLLLSVYESNDQTYSRNYNNNCCVESHVGNDLNFGKMKLKIIEVILNDHDAVLTFKIYTKHETDEIITKRRCLFSFLEKEIQCIIEKNKTPKSFNIKEKIDSLSLNGNFNQRNIIDFLTVTLLNVYEWDPKVFENIKDLFLQLPLISLNSDGKRNKKIVKVNKSLNLHSRYLFNSSEDNLDVKSHESNSEGAPSHVTNEQRKSVTISVNNLISEGVSEDNKDDLALSHFKPPPESNLLSENKQSVTEGLTTHNSESTKYAMNMDLGKTQKSYHSGNVDFTYTSNSSSLLNQNSFVCYLPCSFMSPCSFLQFPYMNLQPAVLNTPPDSSITVPSTNNYLTEPLSTNSKHIQIADTMNNSSNNSNNSSYCNVKSALQHSFPNPPVAVSSSSHSTISPYSFFQFIPTQSNSDQTGLNYVEYHHNHNLPNNQQQLPTTSYNNQPQNNNPQIISIPNIVSYCLNNTAITANTTTPTFSTRINNQFSLNLQNQIPPPRLQNCHQKSNSLNH